MKRKYSREGFRHRTKGKRSNIYIYIFFFFLVALGLRCCEQGLLFVVVHGLLIAVLLLLYSTGSRPAGFSSCSTQALGHVGFSNCGVGAQ